MKIYAVVKQGSLRSGSDNTGDIIHAIPTRHSDALCGTRPNKKSVGWGVAENNITCPKCLKELDKEAIEYLDNSDIDIGF